MDVGGRKDKTKNILERRITVFEIVKKPYLKEKKTTRERETLWVLDQSHLFEKIEQLEAFQEPQDTSRP